LAFGGANIHISFIFLNFLKIFRTFTLFKCVVF